VWRQCTGNNVRPKAGGKTSLVKFSFFLFCARARVMNGSQRFYGFSNPSELRGLGATRRVRHYIYIYIDRYTHARSWYAVIVCLRFFPLRQVSLRSYFFRGGRRRQKYISSVYVIFYVTMYYIYIYIYIRTVEWRGFILSYPAAADSENC